MQIFFRESGPHQIMNGNTTTSNNTNFKMYIKVMKIEQMCVLFNWLSI